MEREESKPPARPREVMLGFVLDAAEGPGLRRVGLPTPSPGEARIRVLRSGVCTTDLEMIRGYKVTPHPPHPTQTLSLTAAGGRARQDGF